MALRTVASPSPRRFYLPLPQRYSGIIYIVAAIVALVCVVYAFLATLVCVVGGTVTGGLFRMSNLALWALMCAQVCTTCESHLREKRRYI